MATTHYEWIPGEEPPVLAAHSIAKHDVLSAYLGKYVGILAARRVQDQLKLTLVDGFSGGGCYRHWQTKERIPGSPLIMLDAMREAEIQANIGRKKPFHLNVQFVFIDRAKPTIEYLKSELHQHEAARHFLDSTNVICDGFSAQLDDILSMIRRRQRAGRAIFVLDQYGYTDVPMSDVRKIFRRLPKAEVILTVATDWLIDHWQDGTVRKLGLEFPPGLLDKIKEDNPVEWRRAIQFHLHEEFHAKSGAGYYTPFFVVSPKAHRSYWLLHFSAHPKARDVMTELHWQLENHFEHYGGPAFYMLGYNPRRDNARLGYQGLPFGFDSFAAKESQDALAAELPQMIASFPEGIPFGEFFKRVVNDTPATKSMLADAIRGLTCEKELELLTDEGKLRQNGVRIANSDIVRFPRQTRIIFQG
ncbi:MAG: three-Cys-motif partner protein TcmP [Planctomycetes bacterium]|nr:three-Cys-motif partner protein TcmP [Planctomycetota bacterium]